MLPSIFVNVIAQIFRLKFFISSEISKQGPLKLYRAPNYYFLCHYSFPLLSQVKWVGWDLFFFFLSLICLCVDYMFVCQV